jgi:hypothetical protein
MKKVLILCTLFVIVLNTIVLVINTTAAEEPPQWGFWVFKQCGGYGCYYHCENPNPEGECLPISSWQSRPN